MSVCVCVLCVCDCLKSFEIHIYFRMLWMQTKSLFNHTLILNKNQTNYKQQKLFQCKLTIYSAKQFQIKQNYRTDNFSCRRLIKILTLNVIKYSITMSVYENTTSKIEEPNTHGHNFLVMIKQPTI